MIIDILLWLAVLPGLFIALHVYRLDKIEHEPLHLIIALLAGGALSTIGAMVLETIGGNVISAFMYQGSLAFALVENFIVVALSEELCKYVILKRLSWNNKAFDYTFDAVVYAVTVALGFAILENVLYVMSGGISVAAMRAITAVPGHACFGLFMGIYYGYAKKAAVSGDIAGSRMMLKKAVLVPVFFHGLYDFCASSGSELLTLIFLGLVVFQDVILFKKSKKMAAEDRPMYDYSEYHDDFEE